MIVKQNLKKYISKGEMIGKQDRSQGTLFIPGSLDQLVPDDHVLKRVDKVLDLSWLRDEVRDCYDESTGRPSIDPESAVRLMLAGFFHGFVHDRCWTGCRITRR